MFLPRVVYNCLSMLNLVEKMKTFLLPIENKFRKPKLWVLTVISKQQILFYAVQQYTTTKLKQNSKADHLSSLMSKPSCLCPEQIWGNQ